MKKGSDGSFFWRKARMEFIILKKGMDGTSVSLEKSKDGPFFLEKGKDETDCFLEKNIDGSLFLLFGERHGCEVFFFEKGKVGTRCFLVRRKAWMEVFFLF